MALLFANYLKRANIKKNLQEWNEALRAIRSALFILPTAKDAVQCHVAILRGMDQHDRAAQVLEEALKFHPYWSWALLELTELMVCRLKRSADAWRWLQRLRQCQHLSPKEQVRCCCLKVKVFLDQQRWYEASQSVRKALATFPNDPQLLYFQGWVALQRHNYYAAASAFHKVLKLEPEHADAHYHLAKAFHGMNEHRLMREHFAIVYELDFEAEGELQYSSQEFLNIALEALDVLGKSYDCSKIQLVVEPIPSSDILHVFPYDPRTLGVFAPSSEGQSNEAPEGSLYLFQKNVERTKLTGQALRDRIVQVYRQQLAASSVWVSEQDTALSVVPQPMTGNQKL